MYGCQIVMIFITRSFAEEFKQHHILHIRVIDTVDAGVAQM